MMFSHSLAPMASDRRTRSLKLHRGPHFGEVSSLPVQPRRPRNTPFRPDGTPCAIIYYPLGVAANSAQGSTGWGGARNRADRQSDALTTDQIANLISAAHHAAVIELPLNRMVTIHWKAAGVPLDGMVRATGRFVDLLCKAIARHGSRTAWLWVHENGDGKGWHCHLLAHVPPRTVEAITKLQRGWLKRIIGKTYSKGVIRCRPVGFRLGLETNNPDLYAANLNAAMAYCLKGAESSAAAAFDLRRLEPGGHIIGKRCSTSQNIGSKARREAEA